MTTTKQYDYLNRLLSTSSASAAASGVNFIYSYNNANQRIRATLADGNYWLYGYDSLGQVTNGVKYWQDGTKVAGQQFGYAFDDIGNRTATAAGGDQSGAGLRPANYAANSLNQYSSRGVPGAVDIMGLSFATNTVTVNNQATYRKSEYFRKELAVNNANSPLWTNITVAATGQASVSGNEFVPRTPESFGYDADGNMTNDGRWAYTWDAENRLVKLTPNTSAGPRQSIQFEYDWLGRRIHKQVWDNVGWNGTPTNDVKFVYDGWNLLAELNATNNAVIRSFLWGTDLSGSLQGAGGVGGLLEVAYNGTQTTNYFVAFDGNGNVAALADAASTNILAQYEYGPFGEVIRATGPVAKANPFRFSTKYQDDESDLLYYGYRYYSVSTGRFLNRDLAAEDGSSLLRTGRQAEDLFSASGDWMGETSSLNLYALVANATLDQVDYLGLCKISTDARGFTIVSVEPNEAVWWIYHSNKVNPVFLPPVGKNGAAGDLGCYAAYNNRRTARIAKFLIPGAPTEMEPPWDTAANPILDRGAYDPVVKAMEQGTVQLVNSWLSAGGPCTIAKVTVVYAGGFFGGRKEKVYTFSKPITSFEPYSGSQ